MVRKEVLKIKKNAFGRSDIGTLGVISDCPVTSALTHRPSLIGRELAESGVGEEWCVVMRGKERMSLSEWEQELLNLLAQELVNLPAPAREGSLTARR